MSTGNSRQAIVRIRPRKLTRAEEREIAARNRLVEEHLEWARGIAESVVRKLPTWFTADDLIGPAEIGLIQAAERYDPALNNNFRGYAHRRVYGACIASIRRREYKERGHISIQAETNTGQSEEHEMQVPDGRPWPDALAQASITRQVMWERVGELPPVNARVLRCHYFLSMTLADIAVKMGVGESWVCRLHRQGLEMLRLRCADLKEAA